MFGLFLSQHLAPANAERGCWWRPQANLDCSQPGMLKVQSWIMFLHFYCSSVYLLIFSQFPLMGCCLGYDQQGMLRSGYRLPSRSVAAPVCRWPTQVPFTCQSNPWGRGTPLPWDPSVLVWENKTLDTLVAMTLGRAAQWPFVLLPKSLRMAGNVICPPGVLVGGYGEDAKKNSLVDHHHLLPSLHVSIIVPSREIRWDKPHCGLLQHIALGRTDSGSIYNHILLVTGKQRKAIVIKHEWSCGKGALKPVSLSVADSCLMLGHSGCFLHAPK